MRVKIIIVFLAALAALAALPLAAAAASATAGGCWQADYFQKSGESLLLLHPEGTAGERAAMKAGIARKADELRQWCPQFLWLDSQLAESCGNSKAFMFAAEMWLIEIFTAPNADSVPAPRLPLGCMAKTNAITYALIDALLKSGAEKGGLDALKFK